MGLLQRLHAKVDRSGGPDACWPFVGAQSRGGRRETTYGSITEGRRGSKRWRVNRLVLLLQDLPDAAAMDEETLLRNLRLQNRMSKGLDASHTECDWGPCCNPKHLAWETHRENVQKQRLRKQRPPASRVTSEMRWLAERAGRELRAERAGAASRGPWWPEAREEGA